MFMLFLSSEQTEFMNTEGTKKNINETEEAI
jgi:hypothetical protein